MSVEAWKYAGLNQAQLFTSDTSTMNTGFKGRSREGVIENFSGNCGDVRALCKAGHLKATLHLLNQQGILGGDSNIYLSLLQECIDLKCLAAGKQVHTHIVQSGLKPNVCLLNTLVNMYAKCGSVEDARQVFDKMPSRTLFTWTIMIAGYAKQGCGREAFEIYEQMQQEGVTPNKVTFTCILNACASLGALEKAKAIHADIVKAGIVPDIILDNTLVVIYAKCGSMKDAHQLFSNMGKRDVFSWNAMIGGYAQHGFGREAVHIYKQMLHEGVVPNKVTFTCILCACTSIGALEVGKEVHADIMKAGIVPDIIMENALLAMYAKCGSLKTAWQVFESMAQRDVISWNTIIKGYAQHGHSTEALEIYEHMIREQVMPDKVTFTSIVNVCGTLTALDKGKEVHADIIRAGIVGDILLENTLIAMYMKCGSMKDACRVFDSMAQRDVVSWSAMIAGCDLCGSSWEAFQIYEHMIRERVPPNKVTFTCILSACASLGVLEVGKQIHADIMKAAIPQDIHLDTALVAMYTKCGSLEDACQVFSNMAERNVVSWNAMMTAYGQHGRAREALLLFEQMQQEGLEPTGVTFTCLLSACSHMGLVDEGCHYFDSMSEDHGLIPTMEHFGCIVDLLGRAERLKEAENFINSMPIEPDASVSGALLGACRIHGFVELAERTANCLSSGIHPMLKLMGCQPTSVLRLAGAMIKQM